ncbi:MAG: carbohydrate binding family 9 domain-containing protein [Bacteroidia bacterium]|nr:carbohydrate binding family 9 domain-containing protein [Bacteroidia bacterium]
MKRIIIIILVLAGSSSLFSQNIQSATTQPRVIRNDEKIVLDGKLEESLWSRTVPAENFQQFFPSDGVSASAQTELHFAFDDKNFYVGIRCYAVGDKYIVPNLRRDYQAGGSDNITILFDTFNDKTNAFFFGINPMGVRREGLISNGGQGRDGFSTSWDNSWKGEAHIYKDRWEAEMVIPFKSIRFKEGLDTWGLLSYRFDQQSNERSIWPTLPREQFITNLAFCGDLKWNEPLGKPGKNVVLIPYVSGAMSQNIEEGDGTPGLAGGIGGDAKIGLGPSLNLDLTFNPDFSQVEVDRQVTNLDRFEIFFPERRQFFLENADLFASFGTSRTRPFFSRRIGVSRDSSTGQNIQNTILYGARLSGKLNPNARLGVLNMATAYDGDNGTPSFNFTVATFQQKIFKRSNLSFILVNKDALTDSLGQFSPGNIRANRTAGIDYNLASANGKWQGKAFYHHSFADTFSSLSFAHGASLNYNVRRFRLTWDHEWIGQDYDAQVGFVRRRGIFRTNPRAELSFYPEGKILNRHNISLRQLSIWNDSSRLTDSRYSLNYNMSFTNTAQLSFEFTRSFIYLFNEFDPSGTGGEPLPEGSSYRFNSLRLSYRTDRRKVLNANLNLFTGAYFNGTRSGAALNLNLRLQPYANVALQANFNRIDLPNPHSSADLWLIGPRIDITFSKELFFTTFIQYNNQIDNLNINSRFQWRFAPVSDLFVVYTENYLPSEFSIKSRSLILKLSYWLNV